MTKNGSWIWVGFGTLLGLGLVCLGTGLLLPGSVVFGSPFSGEKKSNRGEFRKKTEPIIEQLRQKMERKMFPDGKNLTHRVFVSRTLLFLPKDNEAVQPLNDELITSDGIRVGWKIRHGMDLEDPNIATQDDDGDGFTNKEEFDKDTNPNDASSSPSRWMKVRIGSVETNSMGISFSGKSADRYTLRFVAFGKKKETDVMVGDLIWVVTSAKGVDILKTETEARALEKDGICPHAIPIQIKSYHDDRGSKMDPKTKTENAYDDSYLEVQRNDGLVSVHIIKIDERNKSRGVSWSVGDIRLVSLVPGEGEMGPYRQGQSFDYAGKKFTVLDAIPGKVSLRIMPEGEEVQILPKTP